MNTTPKNLHRTRTVLDLQRDPASNEVADADADRSILRICPGCKRPATNTKGGLFIGCGNSFFHVDCYNCKKCTKSIEANDLVLLDVDGLPLCPNCFHKCNLCKLTISENIIYASEHMYYHPECFKCKQCSSNLDKQKFRRSRQSVYCTECFDARVAKLKRRLERQTQKEMLAYGGTTTPLP
ncbi:hypothetical protein HYPSUDRAFT_1033679 [Hypholoma sublateritium FD-334 SS-4]|uniref:LIM zinc-binding domain-containing protein n=1 Tax=Hypholoma sublateritium (strain FD-334 SS-4) TaxID=945553 RepID=A0A0D2Q5M0_HYPSF|nr:hypothetical protein HYPSUDRAFT_1033679 [Hypholoma sublateritium FD-334 SS-4]